MITDFKTLSTSARIAWTLALIIAAINVAYTCLTLLIN